MAHIGDSCKGRHEVYERGSLNIEDERIPCKYVQSWERSRHATDRLRGERFTNTGHDDQWWEERECQRAISDKATSLG